MDMDISGKRIAYFEGRPQGHPIHTKYANSVNAEFFFIDHYLRFHDRKSSRIRRIISYLLTAILFPSHKYDIILTQEGYPQIWLMTKIGKLKGKKLISLLGSPTPYNILNNKYSYFSKRILSETLCLYDGIIAIGKYNTELVQTITKHNVVVKTIFNGVEETRLEKLSRVNYCPSNHLAMLFIGDCQSEDRIITKGLDLVIKSFLKLKKENSQINLTIIGNVDVRQLQKMLDLNLNELKSIAFKGRSTNIEHYISQSNFYLHPARGEAWGISVLEAMAAGLPAMVSYHTGAKELIEINYPELICKPSVEDITNKILKFIELPKNEKIMLSNVNGDLIKNNFSEKMALVAFQNALYELTNEL